jgi:type I restriction enzyme, S subunit
MRWDTVPIETIASINGGKRLPKGENFSLVTTIHLYIRARDIGGNRITITDPVYISDSTYNKIKRYTVSNDDIVVTIVGANIGDIGYITEKFDGANLTENAARIRVNKEICDPRFLSYQLATSYSKEKFKFLEGGSAQGKLGLYKIKSFKIILPPLSTQRSIASILSAYDDLIENNRRRIQLLEKAARLLYKEWFVHLRFPGHEHVKIVDGVPEGWERKRLGELAATNSQSYKANTLPDEINYIDIASVKQGRILVKNAISSSEAPGRARRKAAEGDVIWSNVRPNLRAYALILDPEDNDVFSTGFTILSPMTIPFSYLYLFVTTDEYVGYLVNHTTGASYPAVRPDDFERAEVLFPTPSMLNIFHEKVEPIFRNIHVLEREINSLSQARDLLLPRLMNGEVAV